MKVTGIKQQVKRVGRLSIFIDGQYAFSLSERALLESKLVAGQELSALELKHLQELSAIDALYDKALRYAALRLRSRWEFDTYLQRKGASPALTKNILNKLSNVGLLDDKKFAQAFVADRQRLRPTSRRKIIFELRAKHVSEDAIQAAVPAEASNEQLALQDLIRRKRQLSRYQDDLKLMQYLARQGFGYGDIKAALQAHDEE